VLSGIEECHGRFLGPNALIEAAKGFGAEAVSPELVDGDGRWSDARTE
jgi:hypothetical protein